MYALQSSKTVSESIEKCISKCFSFLLKHFDKMLTGHLKFYIEFRV